MNGQGKRAGCQLCEVRDHCLYLHPWFKTLGHWAENLGTFEKVELGKTKGEVEGDEGRDLLGYVNS